MIKDCNESCQLCGKGQWKNTFAENYSYDTESGKDGEGIGERKGERG